MQSGGAGEEGPGGERYYQQHTLGSVPYVGRQQQACLPPLWQWLAPPSTARWENGDRRLEREVSTGRAAGWGPGLLAARFSPEPDAHCRDEGSPLTTAVFGQEEGHVTLG